MLLHEKRDGLFMTDLYREFVESRGFQQKAIQRRQVDELMGLTLGIIADGAVNQMEVEFLHHWMEQSVELLEDPLINMLYRRISEMLQDGVLDKEESIQLMELLKAFTGGTLTFKEETTKLSCTLPFSSPIPEILIPDRCFVFTGIMAFGPRRECERAVQEMGGHVAGSVTKKVDYLVIGTIANEQWRHSSYGAKILKAVEYRDKFESLHIIGEDHWQQAAFGKLVEN